MNFVLPWQHDLDLVELVFARGVFADNDDGADTLVGGADEDWRYGGDGADFFAFGTNWGDADRHRLRLQGRRGHGRPHGERLAFADLTIEA